MMGIPFVTGLLSILNLMQHIHKNVLFFLQLILKKILFAAAWADSITFWLLLVIEGLIWLKMLISNSFKSHLLP